MTCPFSMCFQYRLMEGISNKSHCHIHMLINHVLYATMTHTDTFQTTIINKKNRLLSCRIVPVNIMHAKPQNEYNGSKSNNHLVYFSLLSITRPDSMTFEASKI